MDEMQFSAFGGLLLLLVFLLAAVLASQLRRP
jgi:hypothetical protein